MRCICCDKTLKDHEAVRRHGITNEFLDICDGCIRDIGNIPTKMPQGFFEDTDNVPEDEDVTDCYNLDLDNED